MQNPILTDFTAGELSDKFSGRVDLDIYRKGCKTLKNFQTMTQGGARRRPGTQYLGDLANQVRLISFVVDDTHSFIIEFSNLIMRIWLNDELVDFGGGVYTTVSPYATSELDHIHSAQSYDRIFFTHQNHSIRELTYSGGTFTFGELSISSSRATQTLPFQSTGNYPRTCAIISGRLWVGGTINEPYTVWASRPYEDYSYGDFTDYSIVSVTTIDYTDPVTWADPSVPEYQETSTDEESITESHAMKLPLGADRNVEVMWIVGQKNIVIGTMTCEYILPANINALVQYSQLQSRYGSSSVKGKLVNDAILFVQFGKKKIREYYPTENSYISPDLTWAADHILQDSVVDFDFQRTPDSRVYCVLSDGSLKVLSYDRKYDVVAWARWETEGTFEQICVLDTPDGEDVYAVVSREGTRRLEKLYEPYSDSYQLDCANTVTSSATGVITYPFTSANWVIMDSAYELVTTPAADTVYTIGFLYTSHTILNRLTAGGPYGTGQTRNKRITKLIVRVVNSYAFTAGYDGNLYANSTPASGYPYTGDVTIQLSGRYDTDAQIEIKTETHKPLMITAIVPYVEVV